MANQFRLLLAALAYVLMERLRTIGLAGTEFARAQVWILRCRLLKVGAVIVRNTRRVRFFLASAFPHQRHFASSPNASPPDSPCRVLPRHDDTTGVGGWLSRISEKTRKN